MLAMQSQQRQQPYHFTPSVQMGFENAYAPSQQPQHPAQMPQQPVQMPQPYPAQMVPQQQQLPQSFNAFASPTEDTYPVNYENLTLESEPIPQGGFAMYQSPSNSSYNPSSPQSELPPSLSTAASVQSVQSANSSTVGSPYSTHAGGFPNQETYGAGPSDLNIGPAIVNAENFDQVQFNGVDLENYPFDMADKVPNFVDPSLIQPAQFQGEQVPYANHALFQAQHLQQAQQIHQAQQLQQSQQPQQPQQPHHHSIIAMNPSGGPPTTTQGNASPQYVGTTMGAPMDPNMAAQMPFVPYPQEAYMNRRASLNSMQSMQSRQSPMSTNADYDYETQGRGRCPHPDCGKSFKDLKAHMLTHQLERPEKCPIDNCEYNTKGFARKYDKNRHTLTHYKGTMTCDFCAQSRATSPSVEKSFNRADVFKRHLTIVHGVEATPPNSRKRAPGTARRRTPVTGTAASGKCSTCLETFFSPQDMYEHVDDCVLRSVQQVAPSEAINQRNLAGYVADEAAQVNQAGPPSAPEPANAQTDDGLDDDDSSSSEEEGSNEEEEEDEKEDEKEDEANAIAQPSQAMAHTTMATRPKPEVTEPRAQRSESTGLTYSQGGVRFPGQGRNKRRAFPPDWGVPPEEMVSRKRVMVVYDGTRRLGKDEMMLKTDFEARMPLLDGTSSVTGLDIETLKRSEALHGATEEEKGPRATDHQAPEDSMEEDSA